MAPLALTRLRRLSALVFAVSLSTVCGKGTSNMSPTAPTANGTWPVFTAHALGFSIPYPPSFSAATLNSFRVGFSSAPIPADSDAVPEIVVSTHSGAANQETQSIRDRFGVVQVDRVDRIGQSDVVRLIGVLTPDVFGWEVLFTATLSLNSWSIWSSLTTTLRTLGSPHSRIRW